MHPQKLCGKRTVFKILFKMVRVFLVNLKIINKNKVKFLEHLDRE